MVAQVLSTTLVGVEAQFVQVEVDVSPGLPGFHIVGLPDAAVAESVHRVRSALRSLEYPLPPRRITVNLAPGDLRKEGPRFDLAIALGILGAGQQFPAECLEDTAVLGELSLDGRILPVRGVLNTALALQQRGVGRLILPRSNLGEMLSREGLELWPAENLKQLLGWLCGQEPVPKLPPPTPVLSHQGPCLLDQVVGQELGRRALEVAAAGGHHLLWVGPPGCGKTLLSRCLPELLPGLDEAEMLEVAGIQSALGQATPFSRTVPLSEPHCRITTPALLGSHRPGEVSRAHRGVLFLDEVAEFARDALEGLRVALETGWVEAFRVRQRCRYPARFQLVAACNPCPCGFRGDRWRACGCPEHRRRAYLNRLSGPIRDRIDLQVLLTRPDVRQGWSLPEGGAARSRERVARARQRQSQRGVLNRDLGRSFFQQPGQLESAAWELFFQYSERHQLSPRSMEKLLRVARSLADLDEVDRVGCRELEQAFHFRCLDSHFSSEAECNRRGWSGVVSA